MKDFGESRREFLKSTGTIAGGALISPYVSIGQSKPQSNSADPKTSNHESSSPDYTLQITTSPIEIAPNRIVSMTGYNAQFPGPLLRMKEG